MSEPALQRQERELAVGDIMRNLGDGAKIMQVMECKGAEVMLVSAGKVRGGAHSPPRAHRVVRGTRIPQEPWLVWTGQGEPRFSSPGSTYELVEPTIELTGLMVAA